jgi:hypothetical protein
VNGVLSYQSLNCLREWPGQLEAFVPSRNGMARELGRSIASGRTAEAHERGPGWVLKLFREEIDLAVVRREHGIAAAVFEARAPAPRTGAIVSIGPPYGLEYERIEGVPLPHAMRAYPTKLLYYADPMADTHLTSKDRAKKHLLLLSKRNHAIIPVGNLKVGPPMKEKPDVLQGTLALMVLKTLDVLGPQHGYGIARRIEQISGDILAVNQGTLVSRAAEAGA